MKYMVSIKGLAFGFDDGNTALSFAELARSSFVPSEYIPNPDVTIQFPYKKKEEEAKADE